MVEANRAWLVECKGVLDDGGPAGGAGPDLREQRSAAALIDRSSQVLRNGLRSLRSRLPWFWMNIYVVATVGGTVSSASARYV